MLLYGLLLPNPKALLHAQNNVISKDFEAEKDTKASAFEVMNRMVQNRALATSLASGVNSLNRTVDSLMEGLFYSLMDQNTYVTATENLRLASGYERDVYPTSLGSYVVVDRFELGPDFLKDLGKIRGLPLTLTNQTNLFITNATHRSDALRKAESQKNSYWRELLNNWLGLIPLLTGILPPSFNPEELYDPVRYLQTPFLFPQDVGEALEMPLGTVRSYGLSGTTQFGIDLKGRSFEQMQKVLQLGELNLSIPFALFREGEHRISILRRSESEVWLSLSEIRRLGQSFTVDLQKMYHALQALLTWWPGIPLTIAPIDFGTQVAKSIQLQELYAFDLRERDAQDAFIKALHGDFELARLYSQGSTEKENAQRGVTFHFRRLSKQDQEGHRRGRSFYVAQNHNQRQTTAGESQTLDQGGEFFTLDAEFFMQDRDWNVLVGPETAEFKHKLSIPVTKEQDGFKLDTTSESSLYMTAALRLSDDFVDTREYEDLIALVRRYSGLPLTDIPEIPRFADDLQRQLRNEQLLSNPMDEITRQELTPTRLGRLAAFAHLYFSHELLLSIAQKTRQEVWGAFARAFGLDTEYWKQESLRPSFAYYGNWLGTFLTFPFRLANLGTAYPDMVFEARRAEAALEKLRTASAPLDLLAAYEDLLNTSHPAELIQSLVELAEDQPLPKLVGFNTIVQTASTDTQDTKKAKDSFLDLNNRVFTSRWPIPPLKRDQSVEEKLASFEPGSFRAARALPNLKSMRLELDQDLGSVLNIEHRQLKAEIRVRNPPARRNVLFAYIRVEQHSAINLGRFVLGEDLLELRPLDDTSSTPGVPSREDTTIYSFSLNGPKGLKNSTYFDQAIESLGAFDLIISLSDNGEQWGTEQKLSFVIENGALTKL